MPRAFETTADQRFGPAWPSHGGHRSHPRRRCGPHLMEKMGDKPTSHAVAITSGPPRASPPRRGPHVMAVSGRDALVAGASASQWPTGAVTGMPSTTRRWPTVNCWSTIPSGSARSTTPTNVPKSNACAAAAILESALDRLLVVTAELLAHGRLNLVREQRSPGNRSASTKPR